MKNITIAGGIGKDAVTRETQGGSVTGFSIAVDERQGQDKRTIWFDVSMWGKRGEVLAQYLTKGSRVAVAGELSTREHDGKTYLTVRAEQITLMGGGQDRDSQGQQSSARQASYDAQKPQGGNTPDFDDEVPF